MKIIKTATDIDKTLVDLMEKYTQYHIATAWASMGSKASFYLLKNKMKIATMVVGTHFYQTHPDFIDKFSKNNKVKFILKTDGVYHPKVYLFSNKNGDWECLIGSANFTTSALTKNDEIMLHITSDDQNTKKIFTDLLKTIDSYWLKAEFMNDNDIINYKNIWDKNKQKIDSLEGVYSKSRNSISMVKSNIYSLTWKQYYKKISNDQLKSFQSRLDILQKINNFFTEYQDFSKFSVEQRKQVAGVINDSEFDWKWFGSMSGAGKFHNRIKENEIHISRSLDFIPLEGTIEKSDYEKFVNEFKLAFPDGGAGIAIASRMLSMKRPDYFVCLDSRNKSELCADFGIPKNVKFETYWDNIISRILDSVWWSSPRPNHPIELQAWKGRVAMIDCLFYTA